MITGGVPSCGRLSVCHHTQANASHRVWHHESVLDDATAKCNGAQDHCEAEPHLVDQRRSGWGPGRLEHRESTAVPRQCTRYRLDRPMASRLRLVGIAMRSPWGGYNAPLVRLQHYINDIFARPLLII